MRVWDDVLAGIQRIEGHLGIAGGNLPLPDQLARIEGKLDQIIDDQESAKVTAQDDVNAAEQEFGVLDADEKANAAALTAVQGAFDTLIAQIEAGQTVTTDDLKAAMLVASGDQPTLDAAVAALQADPNLTPTPPPAPSA